MFLFPLASHLSTLSSPCFMPTRISALCSSDSSLKSKVLPGPTPILASFARIALSLAVSGTNCRAASRYSKKLSLIPAVVAGRKSIAGAAGGAGCLRKAESGCSLVSGLDLLDVRHVVRVEELGADKRERERRRRPEDLLDPGGRFAFPVGADDQIVAGLGPGGAGADVAEVVGVAVDQLDRVVALLRRPPAPRSPSARRAGPARGTSRACRCWA